MTLTGLAAKPLAVAASLLAVAVSLLAVAVAFRASLTVTVAVATRPVRDSAHASGPKLHTSFMQKFLRSKLTPGARIRGEVRCSHHPLAGCFAK